MKKLYFLLISILLTQYTFAQPANDECANAETIIVTTTSTSVSFDINTAVLNNEVGCSGTTAEDYADVWYSFTMPVNGNLYVDGTIGWNNFALYDACGGTEIQCGSSNEFIEGLTSGTNYTLRVFRPSSTASNTSYQSFSINAFEELTNDDCASAENIPVSTTISIVNFEIAGASVNNEVGCSGTTADNYTDIWYDFTMPVNGNLYVNGTIGWNNFALYDTCAGTEIQCGSTNQLFTNLSSGTSYKLRVFRTLGNTTQSSYKSFTIQAFESLANDDCASAENIPVSTTISTVNFEIAGASVNNEVGCSGTTADNYTDIWYDFTMPVNGNLYVNGTIGWNNFALYDTCAGTEIQCGSTNQLFTNLNSGISYKLRVFRTLGNTTQSSYKSFTIQAFESLANDDCSSAESIPVSTTISTVNFEIVGASVNNEVGCIGTTNDYTDIWYDFTMPVNGNLYVNGTIGWNSFALYDTCAGTEIQCGSTDQLFTSLSSGTNYKLRVFRTLANTPQSSYKSFTIQAFESVTNDDCASAENITVSTDLLTVNFEVAGASVNNEEGCTGTTDDYTDIWYDFIMPVNGNVFIDGTIAWNNFALYEACNGTEIQCGSNDELIENLTFGTTYKLRVFRALSIATNSSYKSFNIQAFEIIANDDCVDSETVTVSSTATTVNFGVAGATINNEVGCSGTTAEDYADIWYDFTMPEDGSVTIDGTIIWNNFALYDACNGTELGCFSDNGTFESLTNGSSYKLRVFRTLANSTNTGYKSFTIESTSTLGIEDDNLENTISVYPNPARDLINISISNNQTINGVKCYDLLGKRVLNSNNNEQIDVSHLEKGLYLLKINTKRGSITKKIMIL